MKKFLITTVLSIATTTAFGAASLRAPQIGGTATVATPAATTNTARAGTMRAQTMKTSSISSPASVTTTQSIATPVSTETTDARIALLKGIKGFNPGKIKDTTTATNELNSLNDRIEELTAQLDRAEAAQSTVLTEDTIDAKIDQKLSALGTSTDAKDTYSKTELNTMIPTLNDRGNMTWTDPNGTAVAMPRYWYISHIDFGAPITNSGDLYGFSGNATNTTIENWVRNTICPANTSDNRIACCLAGSNLEQAIFNTRSIYHGYDVFDSKIIERDGMHLLRKNVGTAEPDPAVYLHHELCGDQTQSTSNCWVELKDDAYNATFCGVKISYAYVYSKLEMPNPSAIPTLDDRGNINMIDPNGSLISWSLFEYQYTDTTSILLRNTMYYTTTLPNTEQSLEKIRNWARNKCTEGNSSQGVFSCALGYAEYDALSAKWYLAVNIDFKGYGQYQDPDVIYAQNAFTFRKYLQSFEYDTEEKFRTAACGNSSADECTVHSFDEFTVYGAHNAYRATVDYTYATKNNE